jgi:asparagine synthase (glutamine-hydrolysing)
MSAIGGIYRFDGLPVAQASLDLMMNSLAAHGPDRMGVHVSGNVALGHRLWRSTAEDAYDAQPLKGASGAVLTGDLRIDNRSDLIAALGLDPEQSLVQADAAIALAAWEKWGDDTWARLRGPFAIAIWDPRSRDLTLVRDPVGLRALCYYHSDDSIAFATMPKGLFALPDVSRRLNREKLADFMVRNQSDCETTLYRDVFRLHAGFVMTVRASGKIEKRCYWSADNIPAIRLGSDDAYAEALRERLDTAVRRQLRTVHKVGCFLSGGLDSSSVAALAARALNEQGHRLQAYTQVPSADFATPTPNPGWYFNETPYVESIRRKFENIDITYVRSGEQDPLLGLARVSSAIDGPVRNVGNLGWILEIYRLAAASDQGVLLGGDLGNITISWDGWEQVADRLGRGQIITSIRQCLLFARLFSTSRWGAFRRLVLEPFGINPQDLVDYFRGKRKPGWRAFSAIHPRFAAEMRVEERAKRAGFDFTSRMERGALTVRLRAICGIEFRGEWEAGMLALYGIELRDPTADLDVVEFCLGIPDEQYLAQGIDRSIIRRAMWGLLPPEVLAKRKRGLQAADRQASIERNRPAIESELARLLDNAVTAEAIDLSTLPEQLHSRQKADPAQGKNFWRSQSILDTALGTAYFLDQFNTK